jgi:biopolymer transport protein ExbB/TolQ
METVVTFVAFIFVLLLTIMVAAWLISFFVHVAVSAFYSAKRYFGKSDTGEKNDVEKRF